MKKLLYLAFLVILLCLASCESPMDIGFKELDPITGSSFNRGALKSGGDFSVGYQNGNIRTSQVTLTWNQSGDEDFKLYRLTRNNTVISVFTDITAASFTDTLVNQNNFYDYQISVFAENGMASVDTIEIKTPQWQAPSNLTANGLSDTDVMLKWQDNSDSEEHFVVYFYDTTNRALVDSFIVNADITEKKVTGLDSNSSYYFNVKAVSQWEEDTPLSYDEWFDMASFVFQAPSNLTCSQNNDMSIELSWIDNSTLETGFSIERKINNAAFVTIASLHEINLTEYTDDDTTAYDIGDTLTYRVRAFNDYAGLDYTDYSNEYSLVVIEIGSSLITIIVQIDSYPSEASWNLFCVDTGSYYYSQDQTFSSSWEITTVSLNLSSGSYAVHCFDTYGDGGIAGEVWNDNFLLINWGNYAYSSFGSFDFIVGN